MSTFTASFITPSARRWLETTQTAHLLSNFDRACNLVNQDDVVLALVTSDRGLTPFGLVITTPIPAPFKSLQPNSPISIVGSQLHVGELIIDTSSATEWSPLPDWMALRLLFAAEPELLTQIKEIALTVAPEASLLDLYTTGVGGISKPLRERAGRGAVCLVEGLRANEIARCVEGVNLLAGLGGGLTPAGDDFIVGALLAVWAGLYGPGRESLAVPIASAAAARTTTLSAAYLKSSASGDCIIHWHQLFESLQRHNWDDIAASIKSLVSIGHTSGADGLAGFLAVAELK